jgi:hypothetical protein
MRLSSSVLMPPLHLEHAAAIGCQKCRATAIQDIKAAFTTKSANSCHCSHFAARLLKAEAVEKLPETINLSSVAFEMRSRMLGGDRRH